MMMKKKRSKCVFCSKVRYREFLTPVKVANEELPQGYFWVCLDKCAEAYAKKMINYHHREMVYYRKFMNDPGLTKRMLEFQNTEDLD